MESSISQFIFRHRILWLFLTMAIFLTADQASKIWVQKNLAHEVQVPETKMINGVAETVQTKKYFAGESMVVVPKVFRLAYKENPAAAFSLTRSLPDWFRRPFLLIMSGIATLFFFGWYLRLKEVDGLLMSSFCMILTGAVGNLSDRIRLAYVIDFFEIHAGLLGHPEIYWPTFNIADMCIVMGALGVVYRTLRPHTKSVAPTAEA